MSSPTFGAKETVQNAPLALAHAGAQQHTLPPAAQFYVYSGYVVNKTVSCVLMNMILVTII
jgi:hypothetical protein